MADWVSRDGRWSGRRGGQPLARALPGIARARRRTWRALVGGALAEMTALVGVRDGTLRVIAHNHAARQEVLSRRHHLLSIWNQAARVQGLPQARDLACWVGRRPRSTGSEPSAPPPRVREVDPSALAQAEREASAVRDDGVRRALIRARARALSESRGRRRRAD